MGQRLALPGLDDEEAHARLLGRPTRSGESVPPESLRTRVEGQSPGQSRSFFFAYFTGPRVDPPTGFAPAVPRMRASPTVPARRSLWTTSRRSPGAVRACANRAQRNSSRGCSVAWNAIAMRRVDARQHGSGCRTDGLACKARPMMVSLRRRTGGRAVELCAMKHPRLRQHSSRRCMAPG
jgi:hypothetical protein